jgi:excisionase family DNA binding protein
MAKSHNTAPSAADPGGYDLLRLEEASQRLGVSRAFLRRQLSRHHLTVIRFGRLLRIPAATLDEIVELGRRPFAPHSAGEKQ